MKNIISTIILVVFVIGGAVAADFLKTSKGSVEGHETAGKHKSKDDGHGKKKDKHGSDKKKKTSIKKMMAMARKTVKKLIKMTMEAKVRKTSMQVKRGMAMKVMPKLAIT